MNIHLASIMCKHETTIDRCLQEKAKQNIITNHIPNVNSIFFKVMREPSYHIQFFEKFDRLGLSAHCKTATQRDNIIKQNLTKGIGSGYSCTELPLETETWYIFAVLSKEVEGKIISSVYFLKEKDEHVSIEGVSLNKFLEDLNSPIDNFKKRYYTKENVDEILMRFKQ